jgi:subtilisin family serine protease
MTVPGPAPAPPEEPTPDTPPPLDQIFAEVSPRSVGGTSLFSALPDDAVNQHTVAAFQSEPSDLREAITRLKQLGFVVHHPEASTITLTISGPPELYKQVFGVDFTPQQALVMGDAAQPEADRDTTRHAYLAPVDDHPEFYADAPTALADAIEGVVFPQPHEFHTLSATPPPVDYYHLAMPDDVARLLRADLVQARGVTGRGVRVAMVDSGHYRHPFFTERGYQIMPVLLAADAATTDPTRDDNGHGTMESANLFATAPGLTLIPVKSMLRDPAAAFKVALAQNPQIINCSWGLCMRANVNSCSGALLTQLPLSERPLQAAIAEAVRRGIVVVFSAGNGHISWPAMHPDVIAVGGAYVNAEGAVQASNYASSFISPIFPERAVPDLVGLVGQLPNAVYLMLPGQPGCEIDQRNATRGPYPVGDTTAPDDGWAVISGTSAAAPQIAGVAALLLEAAPGLAPAVVKNL